MKKPEKPDTENRHINLQEAWPVSKKKATDTDKDHEMSSNAFNLEEWLLGMKVEFAQHLKIYKQKRVHTKYYYILKDKNGVHQNWDLKYSGKDWWFTIN